MTHGPSLMFIFLAVMIAVGIVRAVHVSDSTANQGPPKDPQPAKPAPPPPPPPSTSSSAASLSSTLYYPAGQQPAIDSVDMSDDKDVCCKCPYVNSTAIQDLFSNFRKALDTAVPGKWFVTDGTLIGALRYGNSIVRLPSGSLNFVDEDVDIGVVVNKSDEYNYRKRILAALNEQQSGNYSIDPEGPEFINSDLRFPGSCGPQNSTMSTAYSKEPRFLHLSLYHIDEAEDGSLHLPTNNKFPNQDNWFAERGARPGRRLNMTIRDQLLPFKKGRWGGGDVQVPNRYLEYLALMNDEEYGHDGKWTELWLPDQPYWSWCEKGPKCPVGKEFRDETVKSILSLQKHGYASFYDWLPRNESSKDPQRTADTNVIVRHQANDTPNESDITDPGPTLR